MGLLLSLLVAATVTLNAPVATTRATARVLSAVRVGVAPSRPPLVAPIVRDARDPASGTPLRLVEFQ